MTFDDGDCINVEFTPHDREIAKREINYDYIYQLNAARATVGVRFLYPRFVLALAVTSREID